MSVKAITWAFDQQGLSPPMKLVLLALADSAGGDEDVQCWPAMRLMMTKTCLSKRTVQRSLRELEAAGLIETEQRKNPRGRSTSSLYRLNVGGGHSDTLEGATVTGGGCHSDTLTTLNRKDEPSEGTEGSNSDSASPAVIDDDFERWWSEAGGVWRKDGKGAARRAWTTAVKKVDVVVLFDMRNVQRQKYDYDETPMKFRKQPATWLNGECWADESLVTLVDEAEEYMGAEGLD